MHPWVIWNLAEDRVGEFHQNRHRQPSWHHLNGSGAGPSRRAYPVRVADRLAGWAGRQMIATGTRLARRGRLTGLGNEALGAAR
jgi:hypothetical protein